MVFVSSRCGNFAMQPRGGYLSPKLFNVKRMGGEELPEKGSNLYRTVVNAAVWHLMDFASGTSPKDSFSRVLEKAEAMGEREAVDELARGISDLGDESVAAACRLCTCECRELIYKTVEPDEDTVSQIREMAWRGERFLRARGRKTVSGFSFGQGYADDLESDPWVFTAGDTLWALDTSPSLTEKATLHVLVHYLVGRRFSADVGAVKRLGVYNPRLDAAYTIAVAAVPRGTAESVEREYVEAVLDCRKPSRRHRSPGLDLLYTLGDALMWLITFGIVASAIVIATIFAAGAL